MPWPSAPRVTAASPVSTPARARSSGAPTSAPSADTAATQLERRADGPLGVVLLRDRCAPHRHDGVADELLDRAAVALDHGARRVEVAREELAHVLGVPALRECGREADEVGEEDGDEPALGSGRSGDRRLRTASPTS